MGVKWRNNVVLALGAISGLLLNYGTIQFLAVTIPVFSLMVHFFSRYGHTSKMVQVLCFIMLSHFTVSSKYWGGCDMEGLGWQMMFTTVGIAIAILLLIAGLFNEAEVSLVKKLSRFGLFAGVLAVFFACFSDIGMICDNIPTERKTEARSQGVFIDEISYSDSVLIDGVDTFKLRSGWVEHKTKLDHRGLLKRTLLTAGYYYIIPIEGKFGAGHMNNHIYWQTKPNINGAMPLCSLLKVSIDTQLAEPNIYFFSAAPDFGLIKKIRIARAGK